MCAGTGGLEEMRVGLWRINNNANCAVEVPLVPMYDTTPSIYLYCVYMGVGARSRYLRQGWVIPSHRILWDAITRPCLRYLLLVSHSIFDVHEPYFTLNSIEHPQLVLRVSYEIVIVIAWRKSTSVKLWKCFVTQNFGDRKLGHSLCLCYLDGECKLKEQVVTPIPHL